MTGSATAGDARVEAAACANLPLGRRAKVSETLWLMQHNNRLIHLGGTFMKKLRRLDVIHRLAFSMLLILPATLGAQTRPPIIEKIASTEGILEFLVATAYAIFAG